MNNKGKLNKQEEKEHDKKTPRERVTAMLSSIKKTIKEVLYFIIGLIIILAIAGGSESIGKIVLGDNYDPFIGSIIFFALLGWIGITIENKKKEINDSIKNELGNIIDKIGKMKASGEIDEDTADKLKFSIFDELQTIYRKNDDIFNNKN